MLLASLVTSRLTSGEIAFDTCMLVFMLGCVVGCVPGMRQRWGCGVDVSGGTLRAWRRWHPEKPPLFTNVTTPPAVEDRDQVEWSVADIREIRLSGARSHRHLIVEGPDGETFTLSEHLLGPSFEDVYAGLRDAMPAVAAHRGCL